MDGAYLTNVPRSHSRPPSLSPSGPPTRQRITDDILSDLSPFTILEAFTSDSPLGKLRASVEAATPSERAFGIRATLASKKIQEWVNELTAWPWPDDNAAAGGFEIPAAKRIKLNPEVPNDTSSRLPEGLYMGSLLAVDVLAYEQRIDEIQDDMEDLDVEGIKKYVLDTHLSPRSRPSSSASEVSPMASSLLSYTKMEDFTAIVTATVLQSLPYLSQLMRLMDVWSIRLSVLRKVPPLLGMLDDAENALTSGWQAISLQGSSNNDVGVVLDRKSFETMREVLQDIVTTLGRDLDYMLDTLEGRQETLPERWLDRMEGIEKEYGEWVVAGDRKVREGEWAIMIKMRKARQEKEQAEEAERLKAARARESQEDRLRFGEKAKGLAKLGHERGQKVQADRLQVEEKAREAARVEAERLQQLDQYRLSVEQEAVKLEADRLRNSEEGRVRVKLEAVAAAGLEADRLCVLGEQRLMAEVQATEVEAVRLRKFDEEVCKAEEAVEETARVERERASKAERLRKDEQTLKQKEAEAIKREVEQAREDKEQATRSEGVGAIRHTSMQEQQARMILESGPSSPYTEVPENTDAEISTLAPIEFADLPSPEYKCHDPDHDVSHGKQTPSAVSDLLIATSASTIATALAIKVYESNTQREERDVPTPRKSSPISKYFPLDGANESKIAHADSVHFLARREDYTVEQDIPLRMMQEDLLIPHDIKKSDSPSLKKLNESGQPLLSPIDPLTSQPEGLQFLLIDWEDNNVGTSNSSRISSSDLKPLQDLTMQSLVHVDQTTSTSLTQQRHANNDMQPPYASMIHEGTTAYTNYESEDPPIDEVRTPIRAASQYHLRPDAPADKKGHNRNDSAISAVSNMSNVSGYLTSDPSPEIYQAEPAEYFRPVLSSIKSSRPCGGESGPSTPTQARTMELLAAFQHTESPSALSTEAETKFELTDQVTSNGSSMHIDGAHESKSEKIDLLELESMDPAIFVETSPTNSVNSISHLEGSRQDSVSSNASTIVTKLNGSLSFSPLHFSSRSTVDAIEPFSDVDSPLAGRVGLRNHSSHDYSPPDSPTIPLTSKSRSLHLLNSPNLISSSPVDTPITPTSDSSDTPSFPSFEISPAPFSSPRKGVTADAQLQAQISSLLAKIPARIRLTSEPDTDSNPPASFSSSQNDTLRPSKVRRSLTPSPRSLSSMSLRSSTPSFTLAPAYGKSAPRPRHQNGNPEIRLYHLSRSTGEAPIKLFVRLVGEHGERVMVRVGGGWADLGEYLREYASHHGRRVASGQTTDDKVEVQDLPSHRKISNSSATKSNATMRGNSGRSSPIPSRPNSVLECERPMSSPYIRKTRKSVGEQSESSIGILNISQAPSTPSSPTRSTQPRSNSASKNFDTPPSQRSISLLSWTEEEIVLGLAGPKSKPKPISERDAEWVESMTEKVRLASAEKEWSKEVGNGRKSFGELEKVGGTKRLFKRS